MFQELIAISLIISAFLAVYLEHAIYSVVSLAATFLLTSLLYFSVDAHFASVFQLATGVGTVAVLFLSSEMLSEESNTKKYFKPIIAPIINHLSLFNADTRPWSLLPRLR